MFAGAILNGDATKFPVFRPDAALVNYYSAGETLGGHSDDVESDLSKPIVSMSLGCDAIFLQGGEPALPFKSISDFRVAYTRRETRNASYKIRTFDLQS